MKQFRRNIIFSMLFVLIFAEWPAAYGEMTYIKAPPNIQAAFFLKILGFNNDLNKGDDVSVLVINAPEFASEMKKSVGKKIGKSSLTSVNQGTDLPSQKPSVIYVGSSINLNEILTYTRSNKILSITGIPDFVAKGVTLGLGVAGRKPKILLNAAASKSEGVNWSPAIFKISIIIK